MRKLVVTTFLSLDGVMENPAWSAPYWNDEIAAFKGEETDGSDALLLGRVTYEGFAAAWPNRTGVDSGADYFNSVRKYVATNTLDKAEWTNSVILRGDGLKAEIEKLKQQDGTNITVHGSGRLVRWLMDNDLVDVYRLLVYPVVLGKGQRLFEDGAMATLKLVESRPVGSGVIGLIYQPARDA
ncbi:MAG: dihydrofolate reductase family protein [Pleurocapsa minor GSE-CHR-MK-17-07R]|jgi:dihydrofolate reductase|nr:dihydrofolate reductase family protein [Pleurocapsa minor GSE-CHR-MK 17-07R]